MKKILATFMVISLVLSIQSFTKMDSSKSKLENQINKPCKIYSRPWSKSSFGFLIFPTSQDLSDFIDFAQTKTHMQFQQYLQDSLDFDSFGASAYLGSPFAMVSAADAANYAINTDHIIQTDGVIMKPISSSNDCSVTNEYVLTMTPANLNSTTYSYLQSGSYQSGSMNKIATNKITELDDLGTFVSTTPYGYEDTDPSPCPGGEHFAANRPFWGWSSETCELDGQVFNPGTNQWVDAYSRCQKYYVFWIRTRTDCYVAYGCGGDPHHPPVE